MITKNMAIKGALVLAMVFAVLAPISVVLAETTPPTDGGDQSGTVGTPGGTPPSSGGDHSDGTAGNTPMSNPPTGGGDSDGTLPGPSTPPTGGGGGDGTVPGGGGGSSGGGNPGGSGGSGGGTTSGTSGGSGTIGANPVLGTINLGSCPLLSTPLKLGGNNSMVEVAKLQAFLKTSQELDVDLTGIFDAKTDAAVKAFQKVYINDILAPWNATKPSGFVYITTMKKINELACKRQFTLSASDIAIIEAYKARTPADGQTTDSVQIGPLTPSTTDSTATDSDAIGQSDENTNVAATGNGASFFARFWSYIVGLFQ